MTLRLTLGLLRAHPAFIALSARSGRFAVAHSGHQLTTAESAGAILAVLV